MGGSFAGPQWFVLSFSLAISMLMITLYKFEHSHTSFQQTQETFVGTTHGKLPTVAFEPVLGEEASAPTRSPGDHQSNRGTPKVEAALATLAAAVAAAARDPPPPWLLDAGSERWSAQYQSAMEHIYTRQYPVECGKSTVLRIPVGRGGGLGSMFQWSAKMFAAVLTEPETTVGVMEGNLKAYTANLRCKSISPSNGGMGCFYEELSKCTPKTGSSTKKFDWAMRGDKRKAEYNALTPGVEASAPQKFSAEGAGFWWGALQGYVGRLNARMRGRLEEVKLAIDYGTGDQAPRLAMHIRLGDKQADTQSQQSGVAGSAADYFHQADVIVAKVQAEECSGGGPTECPQVGVYIATDSRAAVSAARKWAAANHAVRLIVAETASQNASAAAGEIAKLIASRDDAYELAEEVVLDLNLMLGAPHFVGLCMSQLARYVVGVGFARGTLKTAVAMDHLRMTKKDQFKLGLEHVPWSKPH
jgi:hypothetical protein